MPEPSLYAGARPTPQWSGGIAVIRTLAGIFLSRAAGSLGNFALVWFVARYFGAVASGLLFVCVSVGYIAAQVLNLGLSRLILSDLSVRRTDRGLIWSCQQAGLTLGLGLVLIGATAVAAAQLGAGGLPMATAAAVGIALGGFMLFQLVNADILKAVDRPNRAVLIELSLLPWATILFAGFALALGLNNALIPVLSALLGGVVVSVLVLARVHALPYRAPFTGAAGALAGLASGQGTRLAVFWLSGLVVVLASRITGLAAPFFGSAAEAGILAVSVGIASLGGTIIHAAQAYFAPRFARLHRQGDQRGLRRALGASQLACFLAFLPIALPALIVPAQVLAIFGPDFPTGAPLLVVMVGAQLVRSAGGCAEIFLAMTGRGSAEAFCLVASLSVFAVVLMLPASGGGVEAVARAYAAMIVARGLLPLGLAWFDGTRRA